MKELCYLRDVSTINEACDWVVKIGVFASSKTNKVYKVLSWNEEDGFSLQNVDTNNLITAKIPLAFKYMRDDTQGYEIFREALPELFV